MSSLIPLHRLLVAGRAADRTVCRDANGAVSWRQFSSRVAGCAAAFAARPELNWLVTSEDPLDFAVHLLALLHAGKQAVIPPNSLSGTLEELTGAFDAIAETDMAAAGPAWQWSALDPRRSTIDVFTSGSSGQPKQVRKTLSQLEIEIATLEAQWGGQIGHAAVVSTAPHHHFYGLLFRLLWPLSAGRVFDAVTCAYPDTLVARLAQLKDTILVSNPAHLTRLPELVPLRTLQPPRIIFSSGGPLTAGAAETFRRELGGAPTEVFGSTETGGIAWRRQETDDAWTPMPGIRVDTGDDAALLLHSPYLVEASDGEPWRTDDAAELLPDGRFRLRGRLDRIVKIEEKRVSLPSLEAHLAQHPWVVATAVVPLYGMRQQLGAAVVLNAEGRAHLERHGRRAAVQALRRHLADHFDAVLIPRRWRFPVQLPLNERGKLTQAAVAALFSTGSEGDA